MNNYKLIETIVKSWDGEGELWKFIASQLDLMQDIRHSIRLKQSRIEQIIEKSDYDVKCMKEEIEVIQKKCSHYITKYVSDAAGGSDSYTYCEICGKEL